MEQVHGYMCDDGIEAEVAERSFKLTQTAWGRLFMDGMGIHFSDSYMCFNRAGDVVEFGLLENGPYFKLAITKGASYRNDPVFEQLA